MAEETKKLNEEKSASGGEEKKEEKVEEQKPAEVVKEEPRAEIAAPEKTETKAEEPKAEEKKEEKPASPVPSKTEGSEVEKPAPSGKYKELITQIEQLSVLELSELVKELEDRFGVSATAPMAVVPQSGAGAAEEESSAPATVTLTLTDAGAQKIAVIKALREINPDLGLKEAKDITDATPKELKKDMPREEAEEAKGKLEAAGGKVELK